MAARYSSKTSNGVAVLPWGALDWSHAPCARTGYTGACTHCGRSALMRHPVTGAPCHKVCEEASNRGGTRVVRADR